MKLKAQDLLIIKNGIVFNDKDWILKTIFMNFLKYTLKFMDRANFFMLANLQN